MVKREDKLKSLLSSKGKKVPESKGPLEVKLDGSISPVATIKVIGVG